MTMRKIMSVALFFAAVACCCVAASPKDRDWRTGRLISFKDEDWTSSSGTSPINCQPNGGCTGGGSMNWNHTTYYLVLMEGSKTYYASRTLSFAWQRSPRVTENKQVKFAMDRETLYLIDDEGREFKMYVGKKRNNGPAEQLEECRTTMYELHQANPDLPNVHAWAAGLSKSDLLNTYSYQLQCASHSIQQRDTALLSQFEVVRSEMMVARADLLTTEVPPGDTKSALSCDALISEIEKGSMKAQSDAHIRSDAHRLHECAMAEYPTSPGEWFINTAKARQFVFGEIIARQTGAAIGEQAH
jgi:hypothetical protein